MLVCWRSLRKTRIPISSWLSRASKAPKAVKWMNWTGRQTLNREPGNWVDEFWRNLAIAKNHVWINVNPSHVHRDCVHTDKGDVTVVPKGCSTYSLVTSHCSSACAGVVFGLSHHRTISEGECRAAHMLSVQNQSHLAQRTRSTRTVNKLRLTEIMFTSLMLSIFKFCCPNMLCELMFGSDMLTECGWLSGHRLPGADSVEFYEFL